MPFLYSDPVLRIYLEGIIKDVRGYSMSYIKIKKMGIALHAPNEDQYIMIHLQLEGL